MADYLNRTGSIIVILTLLFLAVVLSTQFSLGRMFSSATAGEPVRQLAHVRRVPKLARRAPPRPSAEGAAGQAGEEGREAPRLSSPPRRSPSNLSPRVRRRSSEDERAAEERRPACHGQAAEDAGESAAAVARPGTAPAATQWRVHDSAAVAARRAEDRAEDRRTRADGRRSPARGEVPRVRRRRRGGADSSRAGRDDVRVQAGRRSEIRKDHRPRRRSVPRDAGRIGAHRSHPWKVDGRHPDSESHARADLASRAAAVGDVSALGLEADACARQDDSRRAVHDRPRDDAAPADCGVDGHGQIGRDQLDAVEHSVPRDAG